MKQATDLSDSIWTFDSMFVDEGFTLGKSAELQSRLLLVWPPFHQLCYSLLANSAAKKHDNLIGLAGDSDMQSSINHVFVLVVFQPHNSKTRSHLPPASACHVTRSSAWARHMKNDICIGLCRGKLAYCSCLLSLCHSFLSVIQFFNLYLFREHFEHVSCTHTHTHILSLFSLSETSCLMFMILHTFTPGRCGVQAQTRLNRYTWAVWGAACLV